jgi:hypothetical protein
LTMKIKAPRTSETSATSRPTTQFQ